MNLSESEENYIKAIYHICKLGQETASTNAIASAMSTSAASVSDMIKRLSEKELVHYQKYKGANLSEKGTLVALRLIRKHRLWEFFLVNKLGFSWDEVHDVAEQLEHVKSPELIARLDQFLGFPKYDPHGDPIPDNEGYIERLSFQNMSHYQKGDQLIIMGVVDTSDSYLKYLNSLGLHLGAKVQINEKVEFDDSLSLLIENENEVMISAKVAQNLLVKKV